VEMVQLLLKHGAAVDAAPKGGAPALYWAASNGITPVVEALLQSGADVDRLSPDPRATDPDQGSGGQHSMMSAMQIAIEANHTATVKGTWRKFVCQSILLSSEGTSAL
jgi:ankyrin repeat protein